MNEQITLNSSTSNNLERKRNKILAVIFLIFSLLSLPKVPSLFTATLHDASYYIDFFNVLIAIPMLVLVFMLFQQKPVLKWFLYLVLIGSIGSSVFWAMEKEWILVIAEILLAAYVLYYVKAPLTIKSHKIANYVLLPLSIGIVLVAGITMAQQQSQLYQEVSSPSSEFNLTNVELQQAYLALVSEQNRALLGEKFEVLKTVNNKKLTEIEEIIAIATTEHNLSKNRSNEYNQAVIANMEAHKNQSLKIKEFVEFNESIDHPNMTEEQAAQNAKFIQEITALEKNIAATAVELQKVSKQ